MRPFPRPVLVTVLCLLGLVLGTVPAASAATAASAESRFVAAINGERAQRGLPALRVVGALTTVARRHSVRMADRGGLYHDPNLGSEVSGWRRLAENVGRGPTTERIHAGFMASSSHRTNILSTGLTEVGVGVERRGEELWVTQVFRQPGGAAPPAPEPQPEPEPEPEPAAEPAPRRPPAPAPESETSPRATPEAPAPPPAAPEPAVAPTRRMVVTLARIEVVDHHQAPDEAFSLG